MNSDKLEILELLNRYILAIDTHDDAQFADTTWGLQLWLARRRR